MLASLTVCAGAFTLALSADEALMDPIPIRRLSIPSERVPAEMEQVKQRVLLQLTREEFERKVQEAARAEELRKRPPQLVEAHYSATLVDTFLRQGRGQWKIVNPLGPGVLPLGSLNLAVHNVLWDNPKLANKEAVLTDLDGGQLGLWVEPIGQQAAYFDWTARGDPKPNGLQFVFQVPRCAMSSLELRTAVDQAVVAVDDGCLVSGPHPAEKPELRLWRLDFAGRAEVRFVVRRGPVAGIGVHSLILVDAEAHHKLDRDHVRSQFQLKLDAPRRPFHELTLECDAAWQPYDVHIRNLKSWSLGDVQGTIRRLTVNLHEPATFETLEISGLSRANPKERWTCPQLRLLNGLTRSDKLTVRIHPEVQLEDWNSGGFRIIGTARKADGSQEITLSGGQLEPTGAGPGPPSAVWTSSTASFRVRQVAWWELEPQRVSFSSRLSYEMFRGRLFRLPVQLPRDWRVEHVDVQPASLLRHWTVLPATPKRGPTLLVDLRHALEDNVGTGTDKDPFDLTALNITDPIDLTLTLRLRPEGVGALAALGGSYAFPEIKAEGATSHETVLAIFVDARYRGTIQPPLDKAATGEKDPPWGERLPDFLCSFREQGQHRTLILKPRSPRVRARSSTAALATPRGTETILRFDVEPEIGRPDVLDLLLASPAPPGWTWKIDTGNCRIQKVERLGATQVATSLSSLAARTPYESLAFSTATPPREKRLAATEIGTYLRCLAARTSLEAVAAQVPAVAGEWWRLTLDRPLDGNVSLVGFATEPERRPSVALVPQLLAVGPPDGALVPIQQISATALPAPAVIARPAVNSAHLMVRLDAAGQVQHSFTFEVVHWTDRTLPLRLPPEAAAITARVNGKAIAWLPSTVGDSAALLLPVPAGSEVNRFEIVYSVPSQRSFLETWVNGTAPELPIAPLELRRTWCLPAGMAPARAGLYSRSAELSRDPLVAPAGPDDMSWASVRSWLLGEVSRWALSPQASSAADTADWTDWEAAALEPMDNIPVVNLHRFHWLGWLLAGAILAIGWRIRGWPSGVRLTLLCVCLAIAILAWLWLPGGLRDTAWAPAGTASVLALIWYGRAILQKKRSVVDQGVKIGSSLTRAAVAGVFLIVLLSPTWLVSAGPNAFTVYFLPRAADTPLETQTVLAAPALLDRLNEMVQRGVGAGRPAVLLTADYKAAPAPIGVDVDVEAAYKFVRFHDQPETLLLPLGGMQLKEALLDGVPVPLSALPGSKVGYRLEVKGARGLRRLLLRFRVPVVTAGSEREARFAVPALAQSRLSAWDVPVGARFLQAATALGAQSLSQDGQRLEADLGRIDLVHVRWRQETAPAKVPVVQVREAYLWDVKAPASTLSAVLEYEIKEGVESNFYVEIPQALEVFSVGAASLAEAAPQEQPPPIKDWSVSKGSGTKRLHVEFQRPVTRGVQVTLELIARLPLGPNTVLPLLVPQGVRMGEQGRLAYRAPGWASRYHEDSLRINYFDADKFRRLWRSAGKVDPGRDIHAYSFSRQGGEPVLRLHLQTLAAAGDATQDLTWRIGAQRAELEARLKVNVRKPAHAEITPSKLVLLEWEIPTKITVTSLGASNLGHWTRTGSKLQIWLQESAEEASLRLTGWMPLPADGADARFELPRVGSLGLPAQRTTVVLVPDPEVRLQRTQTHNLLPLPSPRGDSEDRTYVTDRLDYGGVWRVGTAPADVVVGTLSLVQVVDGRLKWTALIVATPRRGESLRLSLRVKGWRGDELRWESPRAVVRPGPTADVWTIDMARGNGGSERFKLFGFPTVDTTAELAFPELTVEVPGAGSRVEQFVAVAGQGLAARDQRGLLVVEPPAALSAWPAEAETIRRAGAAWRIAAADWALRVSASLAHGTAPLVQCRQSVLSVAPLDGRRWLHDAVYKLTPKVTANLQLSLPADAVLEGLDVDGQAVAPVQLARGKWWFAVPAAGSDRLLHLRWRYDLAAEPMDRPRWDRPHLDGVSEETTLWQVMVPPGFSLATLPKEATLLSSEEAADLLAETQGQQADAKAVAGSRLAGSGRSLYLRTSGDVASLDVSLTSLDTQARSRAALGSVFLLLVVALVALGAYWPRLSAVLRFFWPEQAILLGVLLGWQLGWWVAFLALAAMGIWARMWWLSRALLRLVWSYR